MIKKKINAFLILITLLVSFNGIIFAQDSTTSLAFKKKVHFLRYSMFYRPGLTYQLWHQFNLVKNAKDGDPIAQHELGIRYLLGEGFLADTVKAAYWIEKAANKNITSAQYNYAILLNNGWGVEWNPFKAYDYFQKAAFDGMPSAEYILGITRLNNLVVKKDYEQAYGWLKKAADNGFEPAKIALKRLKKKISPKFLKDEKNKDENKKNNPTTNNYISNASTVGLEFIDFDAVRDSVTKITDKIILDALLIESNIKLADSLGITDKNDSTIDILKTGIPYLIRATEIGNPEAMTLLGKLYFDGKYFKKDIINSAFYFLRAARLNSPVAANLLYNIVKEHAFLHKLRDLSKRNNAKAMYIWYGINKLGFIRDIADKDMISLLKRSSNQNFRPSLVEYGLAFYTGNIVKKNRNTALKIWRKAKELGSTAASIRISTANVYDKNKKDISKDISLLVKTAKMGSIISEITLAYSYENGRGVEKNKAKAVMYYRSAAQRGNHFAFNELKRMYDEIRPERFSIE